MNAELRYNKDKKILYCVFNESFTLEDYESVFHAITHSEEYPPDVNTLWDVGKINFTDINEDYMKRLISIRHKFPERGRSKVAIITSGDLGFGLGRMYGVFSEFEGMPQNIHIFRKRDDGEKWLLSDVEEFCLNTNSE